MEARTHMTTWKRGLLAASGFLCGAILGVWSFPYLAG